jgi:alditol oxidase
VRESNWARNYTFRARKLHRPTSVEEVQEVVAKAEKVHVLGARHSFNDIADSAELISLSALPPQVTVNRSARTVSINAGLTYGAVAQILETEGLALHNLPSLPHITVAGAIATGTHGSGTGNRGLASAVAETELVTSSGELVRRSRGDADFDGMVVGLGALGAVIRLTLDVEPAYEVRQRVFESLEWQVLFDHFEEIISAGYSVSVFTRLEPVVDQVWIKSRVTSQPEVLRRDLFGAVPATVDRHPILGVDPVNCTPQLGRPGPWWERLPHFRLGFTPSVGDELQSEFFLPRHHAIAGIQVLNELAERLRPLLQVCEIRTIASDGLWMSPSFGRDTVAFHFTWLPEQPLVEAVLVDLEQAVHGSRRGDRSAVRTPARLQISDWRTGPSRRLPQRLAGALHPRRVSTVVSRLC